MDAERRRRRVRGPLHGIPFVAKDNFYTDDLHHTSEGTTAPGATTRAATRAGWGRPATPTT